MNIDGLSEATLEKFIGKGFIHEYADVFKLSRYEAEITQMEGFGEKSYQNLINSVNNARKTSLPRVIYGLGITGIGLANAKMICRHYRYDIEAMQNAQMEELSEIEGIGEVLAAAFYEYFQNEQNMAALEHLLNEITVDSEIVEESEQPLSGLTFVITGSLVHYGNRSELKELIEKKGGKVTGSVTTKTTCLINNDLTSNSSKNKKAKELGVRIISEEDFMKEYLS